MENEQTNPPQNKTKKILIIIFGIAIALITLYFGFKEYNQTMKDSAMETRYMEFGI